MPKTYKLLLHNEWVLWPEQKSLEYVLALKAGQREDVWAAGYQGEPIAEGGAIFDREWWVKPATRYNPNDKAILNTCVARYISFDTAVKDGEQNDYTAFTVAELMPDYRVVIREVFREKLKSSDLPELVERVASRYFPDGKLKGVLIEDKQSGTTTLQSLKAQSEPWLQRILQEYMPRGTKSERARIITPFCKNGRILLPTPSSTVPWLYEFTQELYTFPGSPNDDMVDSFVQVCLWLEYYLSESMAMMELQDPA